jgi:cytochrome c-type biogenesis protein CcmE
MGKGVQISLAALSVFVGLVWLIGAGASSDGVLQYYSQVSDYLESGRAVAGEPARVHGLVVDGSIAKNLPEGYVDFELRDAAGTGTLSVRYEGIDVPDLFRDGAEVVVDGRYGDSRFLAHRLMAKCPSKYEAQPDGATSGS